MSEHEALPEGEEAPPRGVVVMAWVRWLLVLAMAVLAALSVAQHYGLLGGEAAESAQYSCPMHPSVLQDFPGECPICGMSLVRVERERERDHDHDHDQGGSYYCPMHPEVVSTDPNATCAKCGGMKLLPRPKEGVVLELGEDRVQQMGIRTAEVERAAPFAEIVAWGVLKPADGRVGRVHTRVEGYVEELFVKERAALVKKGQPLLSLYAPELVAAQRELLTAARWEARGSGVTAERELAAAAREKLHTLGVSDADLDAILKEGAPRRALTVRAPQSGFVSDKPIVLGSRVEPGALLFELTDLSEVWLVGDLPESALPRVQVGMDAEVRIPGEPAPRQGKVSYVYPEVDVARRTAEVRVKLANADLALRPGTSAELHLALPAREGLYVPVSAVLDAGEHAYAFVEQKPGRFVQTRVVPGSRAGERIEVLSGLTEGQRVVTSATFLLDSETRLQQAAGQSTAPGAEP
jgi:Cu(I)/Ag(I) efflux system membrane fusion protein